MNIQTNRYRIDAPHEGVRRIYWAGPLVSTQPAEDAEQIAFSTVQFDEPQQRNGQPRDRVELNLEGCQGFDSRGIALLIFLRRRLTDHNVSWSIVGAPGALLRSLKFLNLESAFPFSSAAKPRAVNIASPVIVNTHHVDGNGHAVIVAHEHIEQPDPANESHPDHDPATDDIDHGNPEHFTPDEELT